MKNVISVVSNNVVEVQKILWGVMFASYNGTELFNLGNQSAFIIAAALLIIVSMIQLVVVFAEQNGSLNKEQIVTNLVLPVMFILMNNSFFMGEMSELRVITMVVAVFFLNIFVTSNIVINKILSK